VERWSKEELKELLSKCWMTHDGMWFFHCLQALGIEQTNELNLGAIRGLAGIEIKRICRLLKMDELKIESFAALQTFLDDMNKLFMPEFMRFQCEYPEKNRMRVAYAPGKCFAYVGIKRIGAIDGYRCGVFYRLECWFRELGISFSVTPEVTGCMMHTDGICFREYHFDLP
jgi:hypothetical protein